MQVGVEIPIFAVFTFAFCVEFVDLDRGMPNGLVVFVAVILYDASAEVASYEDRWKRLCDCVEHH